eukprot:sb/3470032/
MSEPRKEIDAEPVKSEGCDVTKQHSILDTISDDQQQNTMATTEILDEGAAGYNEASYYEMLLAMRAQATGGPQLVMTEERDEYPWPSRLSRYSAYNRPPFPAHFYHQQHTIPALPPPKQRRQPKQSAPKRRRPNTIQCYHPLSETSNCNEGFNNTVELSCHIANVHSMVPDHVCKNCAKYCLTKSAMLRKRQEHEKGRSAYCLPSFGANENNGT